MTQWRASNELGREFLQARLALLGKLGGTFLATFLIAFNAVNFLDPAHSPADWLRNGSNQLHFVAALVMGALWLSCRAGPRPRRFLIVADATATWLCSLAFATAVWVAEPDGTRNYAMLLELTNLLVMRAVIVPSTTVRTFWTGAAVVPLATHAAYWFGARGGMARPDAVRHALEAALFCSLALAASTMASHVIWILRRRVREALTVGQYTLEAKLGEGGMGVVYRARHSLLRRPTAVKLLPAEKSADSARQRFEREVQLTSQLTHPNTVAIYDYGHTPEGIFYYAMEYLDGINLETLVSVHGPQPGGRVVHILQQMCGSLAEAHDLGLVHRDVKPANVILCMRWGSPDVVKIVDFGLVKELETEGSVTQETVIVGTPHYMAPESILSPDRIGPPSDLYAVGAVGYFLLAGRPVFEAPTLTAMLAHHLHTAPTPPSQYAKLPVRSDLEALILRCLAKEPGDRPASAASLASELASCRAAGDWSESEALAWWQHWRHTRSTQGATGSPSGTTLLKPLHVDLAGRTAIETTRVMEPVLGKPAER